MCNIAQSHTTSSLPDIETREVPLLQGGGPHLHSSGWSVLRRYCEAADGVAIDGEALTQVHRSAGKVSFQTYVSDVLPRTGGLQTDQLGGVLVHRRDIL